MLSPGYTGVSGVVMKVTFQALTAGLAPLTFSSGAILANDGNGTNILSGMQGANYTIIAGSSLPSSVNANLPPAPVLNSTTHPNENQWYNGKTLSLAWVLPTGVDGVSYALYSGSDLTLPSSNKGAISNASFDLSTYAEGTWYFYIKFHNAGGRDRPRCAK